MDSPKDDLLFLSLFFVIFAIRKNRRKKRKQWCKEWLQRRNEFTHINLLNDLRHEPSDYNNFLRMNESVYNELLSLVSPLIKKKDTQMRTAICPHERLTATLRFLATGKPYECLKYSNRISSQTLGQIIPDTCVALYKVLQKYIKFPNSTEKWERNIKGF
ncbi:unnamed protein product [Acanthoscelides obtectus]|uniref:Uncharacterized protein n=1 Tax=Acanthoscelides obtectus TaxID=200917 RepID=A0A9P0MBJ7_ACAOB|nr:unnamed protein product [Acanthoscelides obtectus]CAK1680485.1 hypothetical protein AOBTE_LOCUS32694 [Acanthoscelides obtectus]